MLNYAVKKDRISETAFRVLAASLFSTSLHHIQAMCPFAYPIYQTLQRVLDPISWKPAHMEPRAAGFKTDQELSLKYAALNDKCPLCESQYFLGKEDSLCNKPGIKSGAKKALRCFWLCSAI